MADIQPLRTLRYDLRSVGSLDAVIAPPYDVIDPPRRAELVARSPFNVVEVDLPDPADGGDPYLHATTVLEAWRQQGILVREREPALWALGQEFTAPDGARRTRRGFFARVRVEDYGPGRIRPHERTQPGPREDRLRLTQATRTNLSPIFSLFDDPDGSAAAALGPATGEEPFATATDDDGVENRLWRVGDPGAIEAVGRALGDRELLIADGHHRYETARLYTRELGSEGEHSYVLMFLCALSDPGLEVFPTHRLLTGLGDPEVQERLGAALKRDFEVEPVDRSEIAPPADPSRVAFGYMDSHFRRPYRLTLKNPSTAADALPDHSDAYRALDTAVLEALILRGALGLSEADIADQRGVSYAKSTAEALEAVESGRVDAAFFMRATPVEQVQAVAAAGESMPPKSTFFYPKVPTGLVFNPLE
ncbi:MAG: DUF1015 domain-containing protein [Thermoleophilaceae bacterium]|jgi:uncharacterized protein (DUF1015 family)|nr:DUF1015 domain-containing protein [Thermoleophilaceae bacterium]